MSVSTTSLDVGGELFLADGEDGQGIGPLPLRAEIYRANENEIAVAVHQVTEENERDLVVTVYLTDAETTRLAQMLGGVVIGLAES